MTDQNKSLFNPAHLDHLGETVEHHGETVRVVHIYAEAPEYRRKADPEEGTACIDDVARAAVVYMRHFELTGDEESRRKGEELIRFVMYMQTPDGLFHNFVLDCDLEINTTHHRSRADRVDWWTARAIWALGVGARVLRGPNPDIARECAARVLRTLPQLNRLLDNYPRTEDYRGRCVPTWLILGDAADATSELIMGLAHFNRVEQNVDVQLMLTRFAEGISLMRYGSMNTFPYGAHASWRDGWHLYGNSQTQALAEAGIVTSAKFEAEHFYPRLLVEGFLHSIMFDDLHAMQYRERIAYGVRAVAVGLIRLFEVTGDERFAKMAGLAASWFVGNNEADAFLYGPGTGRGYDGITEDHRVNLNAGAESTIEALYTMLEIEHCPPALAWLRVRGTDQVRDRIDGMDYRYRVFTRSDEGNASRIALVMNLTQETFDLLEDDDIDAFAARSRT